MTKIKSVGSKIKRRRKSFAKLGWSEANRNANTLKKIEKANHDEDEAEQKN